MRAPEFISDTIHNLNELWHKATPQKNLGDASYFSYPPEAWRTLSFDKKVIDIQKTIQAFGRFEVMFFMNGQKYWAKHATCWIENHDYKTGALVCRMNRELVFACQDGFVCIKDYSVGI
jgi:methionyl-tRNA formyltransferase